MVDLGTINDLKLSDEIIDVSEVKQPSNNDTTEQTLSVEG
jgi:hypothetical protein